jgi:hypothetical protein
MVDRLDLSEDGQTLFGLDLTGRPISVRRSRLRSLPGGSVQQTR